MKNISIPETMPTTLFDRSWSTIPGSMAIHCVLTITGRIDKDRVRRAARLTLDAEPILGCQFVEHRFVPLWRRYENLENLEIFEFRYSSDCLADMQEFFEIRPVLPLRILLLRGEADMLCIKMDHHVGDGKALQDYAYLLVNIYNQLEDCSDYQPAPNVNGRRNLVQIGKQFGFFDKWKILGQAVKTNRGIKKFGQWKFPVHEDGPGEYDYVTWRLENRRVNTIFEYGCRQRATVSQVLLAAFYIAIHEEFSPSTRLPMPASIAIDLRRFLPPATTPAISNLVGVCVVGIDSAPGNSLDAVVHQIRDQMKSQQKFLGLAVSFFPLEALPVIRHLVALIPNNRSRRSKKLLEHSIKSKNYVNGWIIVTNAGELDHSRLVFNGTEISHAFTTGGVFRFPGLLGLGVSGFRGSLTLHLGCGPAKLVNKIYNRMLEILPGRPVPDSKA